MKTTIMILGLLIPLSFLKAQRSDYPLYTGNDLGLIFNTKRSVFRFWAPTATAAEILIYNEGTGGNPIKVIKMKHSSAGTWVASLEGNHEWKFYTYRVLINDVWKKEVVDPYAKAAGVNGVRAQIIDLVKTNPVGWSKDKSPAFANKTDAIIYELHVRDASIAPSSGIKNKGKYLGLTEKGTTNPAGLSTGIDHIRELVVTHVHLLPFYDINSLDESQPDKPQYNWGYDPLNYNIPEGSYSTNAEDGATRIRELKQLVKTFHENGLRIVMDVVYNHTALSENSNFNQLVPDYYYRYTSDGKFSNASGCGNETASEKYMMRKFIVESMKYWVKEFHIDGFRIDLMGVHDIETMNLISKELHKMRPDILLYGEGWTAGSSPLPDTVRALKKYAYKLDRIAVFNDDIRDGIKGSVFNHLDRGFVSGKAGMEESIKFGVVAAMKHPQIDYSKVNYSKAPYAAHPHNTITYAECHDNHVLWDKLAISSSQASELDRIQMYKLALSIVLTSQGIPFVHAGSEFLRSKKGVENSFESPDSINAIDWNLKTKNKIICDYVKGLIKMRKQHPAFRMITAKAIAENISFQDVPSGVISYLINGSSVKDEWKEIWVCFNGNSDAQTISLPTGKWSSAIINNNFIEKNNFRGRIIIEPHSATVLWK